VRHFAFSDTPAWVVSYAIATAEAHGWPRPVALQIPHSILDRGVERAELPMARHYGLAILPWGTLKGGVLTGKYSQPGDEPRRQSSASESERAAGEAVMKVAQTVGRSPAQVALNWVRQQSGNVIPILGVLRLAQLQDNLGCLDFRLSDEHLAELNALADFKPGFPNSYLFSDFVRGMIFGETFARLDKSI
jgi:aryl-alcohol dehydrogenase-like predicted oxidoreductase